MKFEGQITSGKLKWDLTSKCGEDRRKIKKCNNSNIDKQLALHTTYLSSLILLYVHHIYSLLSM